MKNVCKNDHFNTETLQSAANPGTMELVTQNNAVKSPISDLKQPESKACVYTVEEVAQMLAISQRCRLQPVQQHHRVPCPAGRRKHPHSRKTASMRGSTGQLDQGGKSMAYITKRGSSYSVRYTYFDEHGKSCDKWESFPTKEEAVKRQKAD